MTQNPVTITIRSTTFTTFTQFIGVTYLHATLIKGNTGGALVPFGTSVLDVLRNVPGRGKIRPGYNGDDNGFTVELTGATDVRTVEAYLLVNLPVIPGRAYKFKIEGIAPGDADAQT